LDACGPIAIRPVINISIFSNVQATTFALIERGNCDFGLKVYYLKLKFIDKLNVSQSLHMVKF